MACGDCAKRLAHGAVGIAKAAAGIGRADEATIEQRRVICRACPSAEPCLRNVAKFCRCAECGCLLKAKTANADESCPLGYWPKVSLPVTSG